MKHTKGDLLSYYNNSDVDVILHVANCQRIMGSGIALQIKNMFPEVFDVYVNCQPDKNQLELGTISYIHNEVTGGYIFNLHAQHLYGSGTRFLNYEALYNALEQVRDVLISNDFRGNIGVPKNMGAFRAGGDWRIIEKMLECVFEDALFEVVVVEYDGMDH